MLGGARPGAEAGVHDGALLLAWEHPAGQAPQDQRADKVSLGLPWVDRGLRQQLSMSQPGDTGSGNNQYAKIEGDEERGQVDAAHGRRCWWKRPYYTLSLTPTDEIDA